MMEENVGSEIQEISLDHEEADIEMRAPIETLINDNGVERPNEGSSIIIKNTFTKFLRRNSKTNRLN